MRCTLLILAILLVPWASRGGTVRVPEDYPSILAGVDAAVAGDSVLVGPGTWSDWEVRTDSFGGIFRPIQAAMFLKPGITVIGTAGAEATIVDCQTVAGELVTAVHFLPGSEVTRLVGLTLSGPADALGALEASPLELYNCRIVNNQEIAISIREQNLTLVDCEVSDNNPGGLVSGAIDGIDADITLVRVSIERNGSRGLEMTKSGFAPSYLSMTDCLVADNPHTGVDVDGAVSVTLDGCLFLRNTRPSGGGGGVQLSNIQSGAVRFCTFAYDSAGGGGGMEISASPIPVEYCTFVGCHGTTAGAAITLGSIDGGARFNLFVNNTGAGAARLTPSGTPNPITGCNLFWNNSGGDYSGNWLPSPTDIHADPLLCDIPNGDYRLSESSPAAPANNSCGLIGASDVGCGPVSVESWSWGAVKGAYR